jgi:hypothetical protein
MGAMLAPGLYLGGVGVPVSLRHNGLSMVRIRGSSCSVAWVKTLQFLHASVARVAF